MDRIKRLLGIPVAFALWLWAVVPKIVDWIGRTTVPDDWRQLMDERLPKLLNWLFSTPWWVPAILAAALTIWLMIPLKPRADADLLKQQRLMRKEQRLNNVNSNVSGKSTTSNYTPNDLNRISDMFHELSDLLDNHARPLEQALRRLMQKWSDKRAKNFAEAVLVIHDEIDSLSAQTMTVGRKVHSQWRQKHSHYSELVNSIIGESSGERTGAIRFALEDFQNCIRAAGQIHESAPDKTMQINKLMDGIINRVNNAGNEFGQWIEESRHNMDQHKAELFGRDGSRSVR